MPSFAQATIAAMVTPSVLLSATGLLLLSIYPRYAAIVGRIRSYDSEMFALFEKKLSGANNHPSVDALMIKRVRNSKKQTAELLKRAHIIRQAIVGYEVCILFLIFGGAFTVRSLAFNKRHLQKLMKRFLVFLHL
jgi:hypothetical protein